MKSSDRKAHHGGNQLGTDSVSSIVVDHVEVTQSPDHRVANVGVDIDSTHSDYAGTDGGYPKSFAIQVEPVLGGYPLGSSPFDEVEPFT